MFITSYNDGIDEYHLDVNAIVCLHKRCSDGKCNLYAYLSCVPEPIRLLVATSEDIVDKQIADITKQKNKK